ncbi:kinase-like protein [Pseudovirgaria hyperparasitica]|uniref:Kinase-like protein n=1 Tax=Pseudovirgaria hyperparasitica TaxID=470096 RepID=A0A6A6WH52_9PEZI|nr:kinase-like protein [Pseudovirgaria hyperparasitica]KAF2762133.1 kinase-like protein [Pseudovirgaria hyperparasitica]
MANRYPNLHSAPSLLDLSGGWEESPRPQSSSSASTSSTSRSITPTQYAQSPMSSWTPQSTPTVKSPQPSHSSNPWFAYTAAKRSPSGGTPESRTPQYTSRSTTPVQAPQPLRPNNAIAGFNNSNYGVSSPEPIQRVFEYPTSSTPSQNRQNAYLLDLQSLERTVITKHMAQSFLHHYPSLLVRVGVSQESKNNAYNWACRNPFVALLFLMCEDVAAFPRASFYMLTDDQLPFQEEDLERIAAKPKKIVETQWRVMARKLPRNGQHFEFKKNERTPILSQGIVKDSESPGQVVDRVSWLGESESIVYVRKSYRELRPTQQESLVKQILSFNRFDHPNLAKILCSYAERSTVAFITMPAQCNLDDFLRPIQRIPDATTSRQLLSWVNDIIQAVAFIHSPPRKITHRSIRPQKILIYGSRVVLSVFGVGDELEDSPAKSHAADPSFVYAAPEVIRNQERKSTRLADAFSLGCVFLCMLAVLRGYSLDTFDNWRRKNGSGLSFHANMDLIRNDFFNRLRMNKDSTTAERHALKFVEDLMAEDPKKRWRVRDVAPRVQEWHDSRQVSKRRSLDGIDLEARNITVRTSSMQVNTSPWYDRTARRTFASVT